MNTFERMSDKSLDMYSQTLKLIDLNDYCKIKIFENLEWKELLSVAESNKQLRVAACDVFKRKCSKGKLYLYTNER